MKLDSDADVDLFIAYFLKEKINSKKREGGGVVKNETIKYARSLFCDLVELEEVKSNYLKDKHSELEGIKKDVLVKASYALNGSLKQLNEELKKAYRSHLVDFKSKLEVMKKTLLEEMIINLSNDFESTLLGQEFQLFTAERVRDLVSSLDHAIEKTLRDNSTVYSFDSDEFSIDIDYDELKKKFENILREKVHVVFKDL